jgi:hypothetical protein
MFGLDKVNFEDNHPKPQRLLQLISPGSGGSPGDPDRFVLEPKIFTTKPRR